MNTQTENNKALAIRVIAKVTKANENKLTKYINEHGEKVEYYEMAIKRLNEGMDEEQLTEFFVNHLNSLKADNPIISVEDGEPCYIKDGISTKLYGFVQTTTETSNIKNTKQWEPKWRPNGTFHNLNCGDFYTLVAYRVKYEYSKVSKLIEIYNQSEGDRDKVNAYIKETWGESAVIQADETNTKVDDK